MRIWFCCGSGLARNVVTVGDYRLFSPLRNMTQSFVFEIEVWWTNPYILFWTEISMTWKSFWLIDTQVLCVCVCGLVDGSAQLMRVWFSTCAGKMMPSRSTMFLETFYNTTRVEQPHSWTINVSHHHGTVEGFMNSFTSCFSKYDRTSAFSSLSRLFGLRTLRFSAVLP